MEITHGEHVYWKKLLSPRSRRVNRKGKGGRDRTWAAAQGAVTSSCGFPHKKFIIPASLWYSPAAATIPRSRRTNRVGDKLRCSQTPRAHGIYFKAINAEADSELCDHIKKYFYGTAPVEHWGALIARTNKRNLAEHTCRHKHAMDNCGYGSVLSSHPHRLKDSKGLLISTDTDIERPWCALKRFILYNPHTVFTSRLN